jgi:hypothetical protein
MAGAGVCVGRALSNKMSVNILAAEINSFRRLLSVLDLRDPNLREWRRLRRCFVSDKNGSNAEPDGWKAKAHSSTSGLPDQAMPINATPLGHALRQLICHL